MGSSSSAGPWRRRLGWSCPVLLLVGCSLLVFRDRAVFSSGNEVYRQGLSLDQPQRIELRPEHNPIGVFVEITSSRLNSTRKVFEGTLSLEGDEVWTALFSLAPRRSDRTRRPGSMQSTSSLRVFDVERPATYEFLATATSVAAAREAKSMTLVARGNVREPSPVLFPLGFALVATGILVGFVLLLTKPTAAAPEADGKAPPPAPLPEA